VTLGRDEAALLEEALEECLRAVTGEPRASAVRLVAALGLLTRWRDGVGDRRAVARQRAVTRLALLPAELRNDVVVTALRDPDEGVRRAAVRALVPTADAAAVGEAIRLTARRSLTERALLVDELRRHVHHLAPDMFTPALSDADETTVVATLEMVRACGRVLPLTPLAALLQDERAAVRAAAVRTVPYATGARALADVLMDRLGDDDLTVRVAATGVLGQLRVHAALGRIGRGLRSDDPQLAVASADALALLGREGRQRLDAMLLHGEGLGPLAAAEALGRALVGRAQGMAS
jgi:HEAT repeat protein